MCARSKKQLVYLAPLYGNSKANLSRETGAINSVNFTYFTLSLYVTDTSLSEFTMHIYLFKFSS